MLRSAEDTPPRKRPAYFWWLLANALALCFAVISWFVCLDVFGNPEVPRNYAILGKLKRLPVFKRYVLTDVPNGNSLTPKELYQKFFGYTDDQAKRANSLLMRNYISNFDRLLFLTYIEGDYQITGIRELKSTDFLSPGMVIRAQALVKPDDFTKPLPYPVIIDYIVPTEDGANQGILKVGDAITIKKSPHCAAVIHVGKIIENGDPALMLTVVPIAYGTQQLGSEAYFSIEPPAEIRPGAKFPAF
ncbi:MAG: hypothetical protein HC845_08170 [Akkermansiaceae bacterium]|nr:hypothetical protein [Akkermansiaceae bacterium]